MNPVTGVRLYTGEERFDVGSHTRGWRYTTNELDPMIMVLSVLLPEIVITNFSLPFEPKGRGTMLLKMLFDIVTSSRESTTRPFRAISGRSHSLVVLYHSSKTQTNDTFNENLTRKFGIGGSASSDFKVYWAVYF